MKSEQPQTKEVDELKRIIFLIIASLMVIGLVLPGMASAATPTIKVIIAGPMAYAQGQDMLRGALLAATEIGSFSANGTMHNFTIISCDTNEISDSAAAGAKLAIALDAESSTRRIVLGGFRTEGVNTEIPVILNRTALFMIVGAATSTLLATYYTPPAYAPPVGVPYYNSTGNASSAGYKYVFRASPFNSSFLVTAMFQMLKMVTDNVRIAMTWPAYNASDNTNPGANKTVRIGIFAESLEWAAPMILSFQQRIPLFGAAFGWSLGITRTVSDQAGSSIVVPALNQLEGDKCHVILTILSGPVGTIFSQKKGELGIPAIAAGINVLGQESTFWEDTEGYCEYDILMSTWAPGVNQTSKTLPFLAAFQAAYGKFPSYTAATYDAVYNLKAAIENKGWNGTDASSVQASVDALIPYFEDPANKQTGTSGVNAFYPMWDGSTMRWAAAYSQYLPALTIAQLNALYAVPGYVPPGNYSAQACNYTMPSFTSHDLVFGTSWVTGIFVQWKRAA
jgi:branched-chain amino acid transport system substrate-binding protein